MRTRGCDVAIAGGGPGGAAAAIALARQGYRVVLVDADDARWPRIGEGLPPSTRSLLRALGVLDRVLADGHRRSPGTLAFWGTDTAHVEDAIFGVHGDGLQLDRIRFDAGLRSAAQAVGADCLVGARLRLRSRGDAHTPHALELQTDASGAQPLQARWLIDAGGRSATVARACGARRIEHDRLLAFHQRLAGGAGTDRDGRTWVEAVADGWWYSVLLPSEERLIVFLGTPDPVDRRALLDGDGLLHRLETAPHLHARCREHGWRASSRVSGADAGSAELDHAGGERWLAVGDAALAFDPLSSKGIANALYTGLCAADAILRSDRGEPGAVAAYADHLREIHRVYREQRRMFYAVERRWPDSDFWRAMQRVDATHARDIPRHPTHPAAGAPSR